MNGAGETSFARGRISAGANRDSKQIHSTSLDYLHAHTEMAGRLMQQDSDNAVRWQFPWH
jgi:hypothetical protein